MLLTIPYKEEVIKYLDQIDPGAKKIGSINTIKKEMKNLLVTIQIIWLANFL